MPIILNGNTTTFCQEIERKIMPAGLHFKNNPLKAFFNANFYKSRPVLTEDVAQFSIKSKLKKVHISPNDKKQMQQTPETIEKQMQEYKRFKNEKETEALYIRQYGPDYKKVIEQEEEQELERFMKDEAIKEEEEFWQKLRQENENDINS